MHGGPDAGTGERVEILERTVAFQGHFQIVRYRLRYRRFAGDLGPVISREVFERGHAVAVLPYDPERDEVVLIEQFRAGALGVVDQPWLLEPVAGIIEPGESTTDVARRESLEEAGLELLDLVPVGRFFVSPGGSSETCEVFVARVDTDGAGGVFGIADEGEDIKVHVLPAPSVLEWLEEGRLQVATTIVAVQWLASHRTGLRARWKR